MPRLPHLVTLIISLITHKHGTSIEGRSVLGESVTEMAFRVQIDEGVALVEFTAATEVESDGDDAFKGLKFKFCRFLQKSDVSGSV